MLTEFTTISTLLIEIFNAIRGVKRDVYDSNEKMLSPKVLVNLLSQVNLLASITNDLNIAVREGNGEKITEAYVYFNQCLHDLLSSYQEINLHVLNIYAPNITGVIRLGIIQELMALKASENLLMINVNKYYKQKIDSNLEKLVKIYLRTGTFNYRLRYKNPEVFKNKSKLAQNHDNYIKSLIKLENALIRIEEALAQFIRTNWSPKDLS